MHNSTVLRLATTRRTLMLNSEEKAENVINCISCNCLIFERLNPSDAIIVNICLKSLLVHSAAVKDGCPLESLCPDFEAKRGAQQILDSDGYIYSQKKSRDTALTSTKYNPPTKCKCHIYLVPSRQLPHSGYTAPQPLCISNMPKLLPLRTSSYLPPAPRHAEKSPSSSTTGRLRGVLNGD
ncbi:hypothetical protein ACHWQZ_G007534 [Mnemiopsis leidyi]